LAVSKTKPIEDIQ